MQPELKELIDAAVETAQAGDRTAQDWLEALPEETWNEWVEETLD
jgi:hypothetical protein